MMRIGTYSEYLELEEQEQLSHDGPGARDVTVRVVLRLQAFGGSYDRVGLGYNEMKQFLAELATLKRSRQGSAKLSAMGWDEFTMEIRSSDALGHMEIETQLHRYQYSGRKYWPIYLKGGFEVEPDAIMHLYSYFEELTR